MMPRVSLATTLLLCLGLLTQPPASAATTGHFGAFLGQKSLDDKDWGELDNHLELAVLADFRETNWPISIAIGFAGSADVRETTAGDFTATTSETLAGLRKLFALGSRLQPYLGGGLAIIEAESETPQVTHTDSSLGLWLNAGVYFPLTDHFSLGVDYRHSRAEVTLGGTEVEAGGDHLGLTAGYHW